MKVSGISEMDKAVKSRVLLLFGSERREVGEFLDGLLDRLLPNERDIMNFEHLRSPDVQTVVDNILQLSFAEHRVVVVEDFALSAVHDKDFTELCDTIPGIPSELTVIFVMRSVTFEKGRGKGGKLYKLVDKHGTVAEMAAMKGDVLLRWVQDYYKSLGGNMTRGVATELIELCPNGKSFLMSELVKLHSFLGSTAVTSDMLHRFVAAEPTGEIYKLPPLLLSGRLKEGFSLLQTILHSRVDPIVVVSSLGSIYADMYRCKLGRNARVSAKRVNDDLSMKFEWRVENYMRSVQNVPESYLERSVSLLMEAQRSLKSTSADKQLILTTLMLELCRSGRE